MIRFYYHPTPNPLKISLFLEETGLPYEVVPVDTSKGEQHLPAFRKINPNGKAPAIVPLLVRLLQQEPQSFRVIADQAGKAAFHRLGTLGVGSQHQQGDPQAGGFLLNATGVGDHQPRLGQ